MHSTVLLLGCLLGFGSGVFAYAGLGLGLFLSISIWALSGPLSILILGVFHAIRVNNDQQAEQARPEIA